MSDLKPVFRTLLRRTMMVRRSCCVLQLQYWMSNQAISRAWFTSKLLFLANSASSSSCHCPPPEMLSGKRASGMLGLAALSLSTTVAAFPSSRRTDLSRRWPHEGISSAVSPLSCCCHIRLGPVCKGSSWDRREWRSSRAQAPWAALVPCAKDPLEVAGNGGRLELKLHGLHLTHRHRHGGSSRVGLPPSCGPGLGFAVFPLSLSAISTELKLPPPPLSPVALTR
jgi:hypothetical protein